MFPERIPRVESLMQQEISFLLESYRERLQERIPSILLTITKVQVARNFENATIYYSWTWASGSSNQNEMTQRAQEALEGVLPDLVRQLRDRVRLRRFPRLSFAHDEALESADRVYQILHQIEQERDSSTLENLSKGSTKKYAVKKNSSKT